MIPVKIISKVDIPPIQEEVIANLIKQEILRTNPELTIKDIAFERKLSPNRIVASVDAELSNSGSMVLETVADLTTTKVVENTETLTKNDTIVIKETEEVSTETVADIFNDEE